MSDDVKYIESILNKSESSTLEFKASINVDEIGKTVCSFLNAKGGHVVIGANDKKELIGVRNAETEAKKLGQFLEDEIKPQAAISVDVQSFKRKKLIVVSVWKGTNQPYIFKGGIYFRKGATTMSASSKQLEELIHGKTEQPQRWEAKSAIEIEQQDLDFNEIELAINEATASGRDSNVPEKPLEFLSKYGLYSNGDFTNAAVLLFGKEPARYFPQVRVRLSVFRTDKTGEDILYDRIFDKNLFHTTNQITDFFDLAYGVSSSFKSNDWKRNDKLGFPRLAIREAVLNALVHRDYSSYSSSVAINIFPDRLEISSYGELPKGVTVKSLSEDHISIPVNPTIAHIFFLRKWIEKIGIGTVKMISQCKEQGFEAPQWKMKGNVVTVVFPGLSVPFNYVEGISEGISEELNRLIEEIKSEGVNEGMSGGITDALKESLVDVLKLLVKEKSLKGSEIAEKLERPYKTVERHLKQLRDFGAITYVGSKRAGGYEISELLHKRLKEKQNK